VKSFGKTIREIAISTGTDSAKIVEALTDLLNAGQSLIIITQVEGKAKLFAALSLNSQIRELGDVSKAVIVLSQSFLQGSDDIHQYSNALETIVQMSKRYPVEASDLLKCLEASGTAFKTFGADLESSLGIFTAVAGATQLSSSVVSTAMRSILPRISGGNPEVFDKLQSQFGITLQTPEGQALEPMEAVKRIRQRANELPKGSIERNELLTTMGGVRQLQVSSAIIEHLPQAIQIANEARQKSTNIDRDAMIAHKSLGNQLQKTREKFDRLVD
jgi:TP901 family phage tail tape measure protein